MHRDHDLHWWFEGAWKVHFITFGSGWASRVGVAWMIGVARWVVRRAVGDLGLCRLGGVLVGMHRWALGDFRLVDKSFCFELLLIFAHLSLYLNSISYKDSMFIFPNPSSDCKSGT